MRDCAVVVRGAVTGLALLVMSRMGGSSPELTRVTRARRCTGYILYRVTRLSGPTAIEVLQRM
jgi:hypothetical protein